MRIAETYHQRPFPDLPAWQKLRAGIATPKASGHNGILISYIDRIIQTHQDPTARQIAFEQLIGWLDLSSLLTKIAHALPDTTDKEQQAQKILMAWLPDRIVAFSPQGKNIPQRLKNWLYFADFPEWQGLQTRLQPYQNKSIDKPLVELVNKAIENYLTLHQFMQCIEGVCDWMLQQQRVQYILTGATNSTNIQNILKTSSGQAWAEARLESWMRRNFAAKFKPTGESATKALIALIAKNLHYRIFDDLLNDLHDRQGGIEKSLNELIGNNFTLLDTISSPIAADLEAQITALQKADHERRGLPLIQKYLQGLVDNLESAYQNRWEVRLANYITTDPTGELQSKFYDDPDCNYQYLAKFRILSPLQGLSAISVSDICRQFPKIADSALRSHITRNFHHWVDAIYLEILTDEEWVSFSDYLVNIAAPDLIDRHRKHFPTCNIFYLAQYRLPCFLTDPLDWTSLATMISQNDGKKIKPEHVEKFWHEECRPALGKIARQHILEYPAV